MKVSVSPGKYVVAVSGGVDSVVLLHMLVKMPDLELVVAHYDHGIRDDSMVDRQLVSELAGKYGLVYETEEARLGPRASEAVARAARYDFLGRVAQTHGARGIITAHHQDDVLETVVLNMVRGTGRRGMSSLKSTDAVVRPLLHVPKKELLRYAREQGLDWREDSTNADSKYTRNYIRQNIMSRFDYDDRQAFITLYQKFYALNQEIDNAVAAWLAAHAEGSKLDRYEFVMLPHAVAREIMAAWLLDYADVQLTRKLLERLVIAAKTGRIGSKFDVSKQGWLVVSDVFLALEPRER